MAIITQQYFDDLARYLKTPIGKITIKNDVFIHTKQNETITGAINIITSLLKHSKLKLSGTTNLEEAQIYQWLEYVLVYVGNANTNSNIHLLLTELNDLLALKTYVVGNRLTIADVSLYYSLLNIMVNLTNLDKEKYLNVSRWFDNIQQDPALRQKHDTVDFSTNYLANLVPARH